MRDDDLSIQLLGEESPSIPFRKRFQTQRCITRFTPRTYSGCMKMTVTLGALSILGYTLYALIHTDAGSDHDANKEIHDQVSSIVFNMSEFTAKAIVAGAEIIAGTAITFAGGRMLYDFFRCAKGVIKLTCGNCSDNSESYRQIRG